MAEIPALKRRLIQQGVDVIDVGAGDADLAPPRVAVEALARAARDPAMSRYAFQLGLPAFREAAAAYLQRRFGVKCDPFTELHPLLAPKRGSLTSPWPCSTSATWPWCPSRGTPCTKAAQCSRAGSRTATRSR